MENRAIDAIVVTFQSERFIVNCLESLLNQTVPLREIIVVDNGSADNTRGLVRAKFPKVTLIEMNRNTGFCHANNAGLKQTRGEFVLFANPDTILEANFLQEAMAGFDRGPRVGMVSGKLLRFDRQTVDSAGQLLTRSRKIQDRGFGEKDAAKFNMFASIHAVCGAMALYRRRMIDEISLDGELFDEDFFAFGEDMDVGWRARRFGWEAVYTPAAVAYHFRGGSQKKQTGWTKLTRMSGHTAEIKYHIVKNRWLMILKNESPADYLMDFFHILARDIALLGYLLIFAPAAFMRLWIQPGCFARAWRKRGRIQKILREKSRRNP